MRPVEEMSPEQAYRFARDLVVHRLTEQARSRADLAQALAKKQVPEEIVEEVLDKFEKAGLINDEEFARSWVRARQRGKGLAPKVLAIELRRKGINDEIARQALAELDPEDERQAAQQLVQKKLRTMRGLDQQVQIRRLVGMLARKGYPSHVAFEVVRQELNAEQQPLDSM